EPEVVEPEPEPEVEPPPPPPEARPPRDPSPEPPPPPQEEPPPPEPEPVDFTGLTLTSEGSGGGFTVQASDGTDRRGPLGPPPTRARRGAPGGEEGGTGGGGTGEGSGPRIVPSSDLSRQPRPPSTSAIAQCMQDNYPRQARNQGVEGVARVRIQINPNGAVSNLRVRSESVSDQGFGRACIQCLRGRRWSPPLDRNGNPVATRVTYSCTFTVRQ
ncbi:MAG TPA: energy transducer TonB, partial [Polyangiaceae bacterium LLY-WYZ-15_(1-7)]|nr:energy transducer TonB [Polyangiaceae bacterium LLY-WYZ-15_(1-7)]